MVPPVIFKRSSSPLSGLATIVGTVEGDLSFSLNTDGSGRIWDVEGESSASSGARLGNLESVTKVISIITLGNELSLMSLSRETKI